MKFTPEIIGTLANFAIEFGIPAAINIAHLFDKKEATLDDVTNAFKAAHTSYEEYENLPAGGPVKPLPPP